MNKAIIALDVDGVLADFNTRMCHVLKEDFNIVLNPSKLIHWDFNHAYGLTRDEEKQLMTRIFDSNTHFPPMPGAIAGVNALVERGHDLIITTARKDPSNTQEWLEINGLDFIMPYHISLEECPEFDYLLDDSPKKIAQLQGNIRKQAFLFDSIQNKDCIDLLNRYTRVYEWGGFLETLDAVVIND